MITGLPHLDVLNTGCISVNETYTYVLYSSFKVYRHTECILNNCVESSCGRLKVRRKIKDCLFRNIYFGIYKYEIQITSHVPSCSFVAEASNLTGPTFVFIFSNLLYRLT